MKTNKNKSAKNNVAVLAAKRTATINKLASLAKPANAAARKSLVTKLNKKSLPELQEELLHATRAAKVKPTPVKATPAHVKSASKPTTPAKSKPAPKVLKAVSKPTTPVVAPTLPPPVGFALPASVPPPPVIDLELAPDAESQKGRTRKRYVSKTDIDSKYHLRDRSSAEKPVAIVRRMCAAMPGKARKEVIAACILEGVNVNTAATQFSLYMAALKKAESAAGEDEGGEE